MEYPNAIDTATLARAVMLTRTLRSTDGGSVGELAAVAVMQTYCTCVTGAEDAAEHRFSAIHRALIDDVAAAVHAAETAYEHRRGEEPAARRVDERRPDARTSKAQALSRWDNEGGAVARHAGPYITAF